MAQTATITAGTTSTDARGIRWSGVIGALALIAGGFIVFWVPPQISGADAVREIEAFYGDSGRRSILLVAQPLALIGGATLLWFAAHLRGQLALQGERHASTAFAGLVAFTVFTMTSLMVHSTFAGTSVFTDAFVADPHMAMVFSHLGYVLLMGAVAGAAITLIAAARTTDGRSRTIRYILAALCLVGVVFIYLPLFAFLIWCATQSRDRAEAA